MTDTPKTDGKVQHWAELLSNRFDTQGTPFATRWISQRAGALLAAGAFRFHISANALTLSGLVCIILGCVFYVHANSVPAWVCAGLLWQLAFSFDCADGQLARATRTTSAYGAWLDLACDHVREAVLSATVLYVLLTSGIPLHVALTSTTLKVIGSLLFLHTVSTLKADDYKPLRLDSMQGMARQIVRNSIDTPVYLLVLASLRPFPHALQWVVLVYGIFQGLSAIALGLKRIKA